MIATLAACHATPPAPTKPTAPSVEATWRIVDHVLLQSAMIEERDALAFNGREIEITRTSYQSPFQGACATASRTRRTRQLDDVVLELEAPRSIATDYELGEAVTEYRLACRDKAHPTMSIWISSDRRDRAMTCFSGVCYFLRR